MQPLHFLERHIGAYRLVRNEALFSCPFCSHHKPKLSVNLDNFFWKCWVCDEKGRSLFSLVWRLHDEFVLSAYRACFPQHIKNSSQKTNTDFILKLPSEYVPLCDNQDLFHAKRALRYLRHRGVSLQQMLRHKIGYAHEGHFRDRIIFPSFDKEGKLNFFTGRTFINDPIKYLNPGTPAGYKSQIILNELNIDWQAPVILVEGFMDLMRSPANVIPLFGSTLAEDSFLFLNLVINQSSVYVCLDADAKMKQLHILKTMQKYGVKCYDLDVNPYKDVGDMPSNVLAQRFSQAQQANRFTSLRQRIRQI